LERDQAERELDYEKLANLHSLRVGIQHVYKRRR